MAKFIRFSEMRRDILHLFAWGRGPRGGEYYLPQGKADQPGNRLYGKRAQAAAAADGKSKVRNSGGSPASPAKPSASASDGGDDSWETSPEVSPKVVELSRIAAKTLTLPRKAGKPGFDLEANKAAKQVIWWLTDNKDSIKGTPGNIDTLNRIIDIALDQVGINVDEDMDRDQTDFRIAEDVYELGDLRKRLEKEARGEPSPEAAAKSRRRTARDTKPLKKRGDAKQ